MNRLPIDLGRELRSLVELGFVRPPVVGGQQVSRQVLDVLERRAIAPTRAFDFARPDRALQAPAQIIELCLWNADSEWLDIGHGGTSGGRLPRVRAIIERGVAT